MMKKYKKTYIRVVVKIDSNGNIIPTKFVWSDGRTFPIDSIGEIKKCPSQKVFGFGKRFTVHIAGRERYIFLEPPEDNVGTIGRWFVEEPVKTTEVAGKLHA